MTLDAVMAKVKENFHAGRAFGPVIEGEGCQIIPVAWTVSGGGGGEATSNEAETGNGGGFGGVTWPLGVYVVRDGTVKWVPAIDATRVALAVTAVVRIALSRSRRRMR